MISGAKFRWKLVASGVPQRLAVGLMLFNVFSNDQENGLKYVRDTKLGEAVNTLEERAALQRHLEK